MAKGQWSTTARLTAVCVAAFVAAVSAQQASSPELDELRAYRLTLPKVQQMVQASLAYGKALANDPKAKTRRDLERRLDALDQRDPKTLTDADRKQIEDLEKQLDALDGGNADDPSPASLDGITRRVDRDPRLAAAIRNAGLTPREYAIVTLTLYQATVLHNWKKAGKLKDVPPEVSAENIAFVEANETELTRLMEQLKDQP